MATATAPKTTKRTPRKQAAKPAPAPANDTRNDEVTPASDNGTDLTAAYWSAIDNRDETTGEIPAVALDTVKVAYGQADPRKRTNLVKSLTLTASQRIVSDNGDVDTGLARAVKVLTALLAEAREETNRSERPPHDPVPEVAAILAALDRFRTNLVDALTDDQRQRLATVEVTDDDATTADTAIGKALDRIRSRAIDGRNGYSGPRTSAKETAEAVRKAVEAADHPLTLAEMAKAAGIEQSTAYTRHTANNTPGVTATTNDKGHRVFVKATAA
jgi:hypothetical protein